MVKFKTLLFCITLLPTFAYAQNNALFVIAGYSEGVSVDNTPITIGQTVYSNSKELIIPKGGYALVILKKGYPQKLTKSILTKKVGQSINGVDPRILYGPTICNFGDIDLMGAPTSPYSHLAGDSILIAIKALYGRGKPPYKIELTDMYGTVLSSDSTVANWKTIEVRRLLMANQYLLFRVSGKGFSSENLIKPFPDAQKESLNLEVARVTNARSSELLKLAILELSNLYYDHMFLLYQLTRSNYQTNNEILAAYFTRLKKKYEFDLFDFQK
jgi:hypothetical protein